MSKDKFLLCINNGEIFWAELNVCTHVNVYIQLLHVEVFSESKDLATPVQKCAYFESTKKTMLFTYVIVHNSVLYILFFYFQHHFVYLKNDFFQISEGPYFRKACDTPQVH